MTKVCSRTAALCCSRLPPWGWLCTHPADPRGSCSEPRVLAGDTEVAGGPAYFIVERSQMTEDARMLRNVCVGVCSRGDQTGRVLLPAQPQSPEVHGGLECPCSRACGLSEPRGRRQAARHTLTSFELFEW